MSNNNTQDQNSNRRNCLVFVTHRMDNDIMRYLKFLKTAAEGIMDLVVLYDTATSKMDTDNCYGTNFYTFDSTKLQGFFHKQDHLLPNPLVALLEYAKGKRYSHYMLMENDIIFNGEFRSFLKLMDSDSDVDYIHIATDVEGGPQHHWPIKYINNNPFDRLYFAWSQLAYLSKSFLDELELFMQDNDSFYYEFLLPTLAYNKMLNIRQFENYGYRFIVSWGSAEVYEYKYINELQPNTFYHPIKNLEIADFI